jgi:adenine deaminase
MKIKGKLINIHNRRIADVELTINMEKISAITEAQSNETKYIMPGLIDSHIHIESSMLTPGNFARACVPHGTISVVSDPHEIANVLGVRGINYMIRDSEKVPVKFWYGAPSCVPATDYETSGGRINSEKIKELINRREIKFLAEVMNFPGVIYDDVDIKSKLNWAKIARKPIDGHAPGLSGEKLKKYINAGISTDHECSNIKEAKEKISLGMKILIREGSAARNLDDLKDLYKTDPDKIMLCSDDLHPEMLKNRHINKLVAKLISEGYDLFDVIRSATINPVEHYGITAGLLRKGDNADFIIVDNPKEMNVLETWINGEKVYDRGKLNFKYSTGNPINNFNCSKISERDIIIENKNLKFRIIQAYDGQLLTNEIIHGPVQGKTLKPMQKQDILKIVVKDRYNDAAPAVGFISGFGFSGGALAGSVAHDSHNIIAVGTNDNDIVSVINEIVRLKGGLAVAKDGKTSSLQLDVAGIMSRKSCSKVAERYESLTKKVKEMGCKMSAPFMTLSFMALLVIPELKLSDKGLFDGKRFCPVTLFVE